METIKIGFLQKDQKSMPGQNLSVCIITYNEEQQIRDCLESIKWADEIVVVDSYSTDGTMDICREYICQLYQREWPGHIEQKNFVLNKATNDWVLCIDADERVSTELKNEIEQLLSQNEISYDGFKIPRKTYYLGRWIRHCGWYPDYKLRLVKRGKAQWGGINPHDRLLVEGKSACLRGDLIHYTYRGIRDHLRTIDSFSTIMAEEIYRRGKGLVILNLLLRPIFTFLKKYILQLGFLDGVPGFIVSVLAAYYVFARYAKLYELWRGKK